MASPTTSVVTSIAPSGILPKSMILLRKSPVFYIRPTILQKIRKSKYSETLSVGVPQLEITGLPGTLANLFCILGKT